MRCRPSDVGGANGRCCSGKHHRRLSARCIATRQSDRNPVSSNEPVVPPTDGSRRLSPPAIALMMPQKISVQLIRRCSTGRCRGAKGAFGLRRSTDPDHADPERDELRLGEPHLISLGEFWPEIPSGWQPVLGLPRRPDSRDSTSAGPSRTRALGIRASRPAFRRARIPRATGSAC